MPMPNQWTEPTAAHVRAARAYADRTTSAECTPRCGEFVHSERCPYGRSWQEAFDRKLAELERRH